MGNWSCSSVISLSLNTFAIIEAQEIACVARLYSPITIITKAWDTKLSGCSTPQRQHHKEPDYLVIFSKRFAIKTH